MVEGVRLNAPEESGISVYLQRELLQNIVLWR